MYFDKAPGEAQPAMGRRSRASAGADGFIPVTAAARTNIDLRRAPAAFGAMRRPLVARTRPGYYLSPDQGQEHQPSGLHV